MRKRSIHVVRPERTTIDKPGVRLHQRCAGEYSLPSIVWRFNPANRDERHLVADMRTEIRSTSRARCLKWGARDAAVVGEVALEESP